MAEKDTGQRLWYLRRSGQQAGPFSSAKVRRLLLKGQVHLDDEVSLDRSHWQPVQAVAEVVPRQMRAGGESVELPAVAPHPFPWVAILVSLCLVAAIAALAIHMGGQVPESSVDCSVTAQPGVDWRNCRMPGEHLAGLDMRGALLQNADLSGVGLAGTDLSGAVLDYAGLRQADLAYAILSGASARGADLRQADLSQADLSNADLRFADLRQANLNQANLSGASLGNSIWVDGRVCAAASSGVCLAAPAAADAAD